jgi:uncharacterized protein YgiM (DUF1202 family)
MSTQQTNTHPIYPHIYCTHKVINKTHPKTCNNRISKLLQGQQNINKNNTKAYVFQGIPLTRKESSTKKVEENKEKGKKKKNTYATISQYILINILYIYFILLNLIRQYFTKNSYFNTLLVILILNIKQYIT